jgi:uncharacterized repeat protein (TIGR01451 family)
VTQADVDSGSVTNTATASGTNPSGSTVSSAAAFTTVMANSATSSMTLAASSDTPSFRGAGDEIDYQYTVTNTGTTTLSDIAVTDGTTNPNSSSSTPVTVTCPSTPLAPGADVVCTSAYTVTQADVDSGQAAEQPPTNNDDAGTPWVQDAATETNTTTATAENPSSAEVDATAPDTVYVYGTDATADISLVKTLTSTSPFTAAGQVLTYSYLVTNTGTISLTDVGVADQVSTPGDVTVLCQLDPGDLLAPGQSETCSGSYTTTATDVSNGGVTNNADASGLDVDFEAEVDATDSKSISYTGP